MKKTIILLLILLIISCSKSPEKLLEKGDSYINNLMFDKAIATYQLVISKFPDDTLAEKAQYSIAWVEIDKQQKYNKGFETLKNISENHPDSETGKAAKNDLEIFPRWLINKTNELRSDSTSTDALMVVNYLIDNFKDDPIVPEALYLKGNIYLNDLKEYYHAINTYQEIIYKYKGTSFEPMSKFMIGYIYANVQNDYRKAEITYSEFIKEFPEHELVPSVKFELEYLGKQIKNIEDLKTRKN